VGGLVLPFRLILVEQSNAGAARARHRGIEAAHGRWVLITDDDMQVAPDFVERHLRRHQAASHLVVLGSIQPDPSIHSMLLFERWYARFFARLHERLSRPGFRPKGTALYTGNVSLERRDYLAVGGFDPTLGQSEDVDLGIRLEKTGCVFEYAPEAPTCHGSDHSSFDGWLRRASRYGTFEWQMARKHADVPDISPYRFLHELHWPAPPLLLGAALWPRASRPASALILMVSRLVDRLGFEAAACAGLSVVYTMEYFRGVREAAGSRRSVLEGLSAYRRGDGATPR
jgi:GT2 family glycosyltransferase